jgi:hypothetical protein
VQSCCLKLGRCLLDTHAYLSQAGDRRHYESYLIRSTTVDISRELTDQIRKAWHEFIDQTEQARPDLYRYCRGLTGNVWDAEDLVQETLVRTFVRFAEVHVDMPLKN